MYLLDTNVISELRKVENGKANRRVVAWANSVQSAELYLSVLSVEELERGILLRQRRDPAQAALIPTWLESHVLPAFAERILPVDIAVARRCAAMHVPNPRPVRDALIAATASVHGFKVVTRNAADFAPTGVEVLNPWD